MGLTLLAMVAEIAQNADEKVDPITRELIMIKDREGNARQFYRLC